MARLSFFLAGVLFSVGLAVSGMTRPDKVIGFLDFFGDWDPALLFVMGGAVTVNLVAFRRTLKAPKPVFAPKFGIPSRRDLDFRLLGGAVLFGLGWGLGGFCPGPGLASLASFGQETLTFVVAMIAGMYAFKFAHRALTRPTAPAPAAASDTETSSMKRARI